MPTTSMPCCSASRRCSGLYGLFGGGRAVERQDDGHAPGALLRLEAAVEGQLADGDAEEALRLALRRHQRQQQAFAVARPVPLVIEPAEHHADRRLFHTGAEIAQHPVTRLRFQNLPDMLRSEEHTSELQSLMRISYAVFCL